MFFDLGCKTQPKKRGLKTRMRNPYVWVSVMDYFFSNTTIFRLEVFAIIKIEF